MDCIWNIGCESWHHRYCLKFGRTVVEPFGSHRCIPGLGDLNPHYCGGKVVGKKEGRKGVLLLFGVGLHLGGVNRVYIGCEIM